MLNTLSPKQQQWQLQWPSGFVGFLATVQLLVTSGIIGTETTSLIFDPYHSMIFAGYFCSLFFMITWISMFSVTCCNRHSPGCAAHALIENILSIIAASVLLYFDILFLNNPFRCHYGTIYDCFSPPSYWNSIYNPDNYTVKMACIKAQLACAAAMLVTNVIYIIIFTVVSIKTRNASTQVTVAPVYVGTQPINYAGQRASVFVPAASQQQNSTQGIVQCHNCHTLIRIA